MCEAELLAWLFTQHGLTHVAHPAAQVGVRYSISHSQSYIRQNLQCFISLLETHRRFPLFPCGAASQRILVPSVRLEHEDALRRGRPYNCALICLGPVSFGQLC